MIGQVRQPTGLPLRPDAQQRGEEETMDWVKWHEGYEVSPALIARLHLVRAHIANCLDACPPGPVQVISVCAGDGQDLIGALTNHPRRVDVNARLVELERQLVERGRGAAEAAGLAQQLEFVTADATMSSAYKGIVPASLVLLCGVFGNVQQAEIPRLLGNLSCLCRRDGFVVWTHHRFQDGARQIALIRELLSKSAFEGVCFDVTPEGSYGVGTHRHLAEAAALPEGQQLFEFSGFDRLTGQVGRKGLRRGKGRF